MPDQTRDPKVELILGYGGQDPDYLRKGYERIDRRQLHRDLSLAMVCPTRGVIPAYVVDSWLSLAGLPNQPRTNLFVRGMEVGAAYNFAIAQLLAHPATAQWRYMLTIEEDNVPPPFGLIDLVCAADEGDWDILGGLYWTKGIDGVPQIWGKHTDDGPLSFAPWSPWHDPDYPYESGQIVRCHGTGMGFTLFKLDLFRRMPGPWFETTADPTRGIHTQDLWFYKQAADDAAKLRVGVHTGIKVLHYDVDEGVGW